MVTRSEWTTRVCSAYSDETCPRCGYQYGSLEVDEEAVVWGYCFRCDRSYWVAREFFPDHFDPEPEEDDIPF